MEIKAVINERFTKPEIHVCNNEMNKEVKGLLLELNAFISKGIPVKDEDGEQVFVKAKDILLVYAESAHVYVRTATGIYESQDKLYELEDELGENGFIRISKSEIVNLKRIQRLDLSMTGTIRVILSDGSECFTSRRNVTKLKKALGV